ncbi:MAG: tyrosinase family protein [Saprospiraceae bacterium]
MTSNFLSSKRFVLSQIRIGKAIIFSFFIIFGLAVSMQAQRAARPSISDATLWGDASKRTALKDLILAWITEPMNTQHGDEFPSIHNTSNFLPWHRIHIRELENFINEANPNLLQPSGLLPYYNPANPMPAEFVDVVADFVPANEQFPMDATPNYNPTFNLCTTANSNPGTFSNNLESNYHNGGHVAMSGTMGGTENAAACAIFWPWHAWVDEKWFQWECSCSNVFTMDTPAELNITANTTWGTNRTVRGVVTVNSGKTLTINGGAVIRFAPSEYNGCVTRIDVEPGGRLVVNNATLTGLDNFGTVGDGPTPGIHYFTGWEGIIVKGSGGTSSLSAQGWITVNGGSIIEHTTTAIEAINGGWVRIDGAKFKNNRFDVVIRDHKFAYLGYIRNCEMINDKILRDISWTSSPVGGQEIEHHFNHEDSHSSEVHVTVGDGMFGVKGLSMSNCTIDNPFKDPHGKYKSIGIKTGNSRCTLNGSAIKEQVRGIEGANSIPGPGRHIGVTNTSFTNNTEGINLKGVDHSYVTTGCSFFIPKTFSQGMVPAGIKSDGSGALTIADNTFTETGTGSDDNYGVLLANTSNLVASIEKRNTFTGLEVASQAEGGNGNLQIRCNSFNDFDYGIAVTSGVLAHQGLCNGSVSGPAGNTWDNLNGCSGNESQIHRFLTAAPFEYRAHSNLFPICTSAGVDVQNCLIASSEFSCPDPPLCPTPPCPKEIVISDLESQKRDANPPTVISLTFRQQAVLQDELNLLLEDENQGIDPALDFIALVEPITATYPVHKAALLLQKSESGVIAAGTTEAINSLPATDPNKVWLNFQLDLLETNRDFTMLSITELEMVEDEAEQPTKSGAHARAMLKIGFGRDINKAIEPINLERSTRPASASKLFENGLNIAPNPTKNWVLASFDAPQTSHRSALILSDLSGRVVREMDLSEVHGPSQISFSLERLPEGVYLLRLLMDGQPKGIQKVVVMH